jgi:hypothetical protein
VGAGAVTSAKENLKNPKYSFETEDTVQYKNSTCMEHKENTMLYNKK